jgi:TRAP-type C4-dicarboxylate transport system permease small subunit
VSARSHAAPAGRDGALRRAVRLVTAVEMSLAAGAVALIFVLILVQAGQRYLPIDGWPWTGELARFSLVWLTFVAAGVLVTRDGHIALQVIDAAPSPLVVRSVHVLANLLVAGVALLFVRECWTLYTGSGNLRSPAMRMPMGWHYLLPLLGFVSTAVRALTGAVLVVRHGVPAGHDPEALAIPVNKVVQ